MGQVCCFGEPCLYTCYLLEVLKGGLRGSGVRMGTPARRRRTRGMS